MSKTLKDVLLEEVTDNSITSLSLIKEIKSEITQTSIEYKNMMADYYSAQKKFKDENTKLIIDKLNQNIKKELEIHFIETEKKLNIISNSYNNKLWYLTLISISLSFLLGFIIAKYFF